MVLGAGHVGRAAEVKTVDVLDRCDPASFNAAFGPGVCVFAHQGVGVDKFLSLLERVQHMGAWHFAPGVVRLQEGQAVQARNSGGEVHTFTEVDEFGGGFIPELNDLVGLKTVARECLAAVVIPPGGSSSETEHEAGVEKYQCCIHPWMRATVTVR